MHRHYLQRGQALPGMRILLSITMTVLAIDPSLTSAGYAYRRGDQLRIGTLVAPKHCNRGVARLNYLESEVKRLIDTALPTLIVYEGYALGIKKGGNRPYDTGELGGVLKLLIYRRAIPLLLVPPHNLKMFVTGKGNAKKDQVEVACMRHRGARFNNQDESDAYGLLWMGEAYENPQLIQGAMRDTQYRAYEGCELFAGM